MLLNTLEFIYLVGNCLVIVLSMQIRHKQMNTSKKSENIFFLNKHIYAIQT